MESNSKLVELGLPIGVGIAVVVEIPGLTLRYTLEMCRLPHFPR